MANTWACAPRASTSAGTCEDLPGGEAFRQRMNRLESTAEQLAAVDAFFKSQQRYGERLQYRPAQPTMTRLAA